MDRFKQYLQEHADELDTDRPRDKVWLHIQQQTGRAPKRKVYMLQWQLAAACLAGIIGLSIWWFTPETGKKPVAVQYPKADTSHSTTELAQTNNLPDNSTEINSLSHTNNVTPARKPAKTASRYEATTKEENKESLAQQEADKKEEYEPSPLHHLEAGFIHIINLQLGKVRTTPIYSENADYFSSFKKQFFQLNEDEKAWKRKTANSTVTEEQLNELITIYEQKLTVLKLLQAEIIKTNKHFRQTQSAAVSAASFMDI